MGFWDKIRGIFGNGAEGDYSKDIDGYYRSADPAPSSEGRKKKTFLSRLSSLIHRAEKPQWCGITLSLSSACYLARRLRDGKEYSEKTIPRGDRAPRVISVPSPFLKNVQRQILSKILEPIDLHPAAHGFVKKRSIFTAVEPHAGKRVLVAMDIRSFFDTITVKRVFGVFKATGFSIREAALLAEICTRNGRLPQGAPTSPAISNIVCKRLDARLAGLAAKRGFSYTRYADDLFFSGGEKVAGLIPVFRKIIEEEGFETAPEKTRIMRSGSRQRALSLNLNTKVSVPRKVRRLIRAMVHKQSVSGVPDEDLIPFLQGHIALMKTVHPKQAAELKRKLALAMRV
jgi:retron-type reverse transcriptase